MKLAIVARATVSGLALAIAAPAFSQEQPAEPAEELAEAAPDAPAAEAPTQDGNEIVVTATKRERSLQDTPVAVSVTTAETIERAQIRDIADLQSLVPSLRVSQNQNASATSYAIRGFGTSGNNVGLEPSVAVFVDGIYRSRAISQISDLPDIQRVEVLRGPQSTLFGKNASAGVISIVTRQPSYKFGGSVEASYGNYNAVVVKGYVTGGLTDTLAASLAAGYNRRDGYLTNLFNGDDLNDRNRWFVRGQLRFEPSTNLRVRVIGDYDRIDETCCGVVNLRPAIPGPTAAILAIGGRINDFRTPFADQVYSDVVPTNRIRNGGLSAQVDYDFGPLTFTSITAWRDTDLGADQDTDFTSARLATGANIGQARLKTFTQEARVATNLDGPLNLLLGGYYFDEKARTADRIVLGPDFRSYVDLLIRGLSGNPAFGAAQLEAALGRPANTFWQAGQGFFDAYRQHDAAYSFFGNADFKLGGKLTVTLGANYTHDAKDVTSNSNSTDLFSAAVLPAPFAGFRALQFLPPFLNIPNAIESGKTRDGDFGWTARLAYEISDRVNAYASWATGFKASSFNLGRDSRPSAADLIRVRAAGLAVNNLTSGGRFAAPEDSEVFEVGLKGNWGVASANFTIFKQSIDNFQTNTFTGSAFLLGNAEKQSTFGIEFDGQVRPVRELTLSLAMTYLDPKYDKFTNSAFGDVSGTRIVNIPPLSATFGLDWNHELGNSGRIILHTDFNYQSQVQAEPGLLAFVTTNPDGTPNYAAARIAAQPYKREVNDLNASLTYALPGGLKLTVWGRNILDNRTITDIFDSVAQAGSVSGYTNQPRTYGVSARFKF